MDAPNLVITINEARKILGNDAKKLSDDEVEEIIINLQSIARLYIQSVPKF